MNASTDSLPTVSQQEVSAYLVGLVRDGAEPVTYSDLLEHFGHPRISRHHLWHQSPMKSIFSALDTADINGGRPLRTTMVVRKDKRIPGNGYFRTLGQYRGITISTDESERRELHAAEMKRLAELYRPGGKATD